MIIWSLFAITLVIVSLNDFLFFRIENEVVLFLLGLYAISFVLGVSGSNFVLGASMAVAVFAITYVMNRKNLIGGGDVKLLFPLLLFAESDMNEFVLGMSVSGVLLCVVYMLFAKKIFLFRKKIITQLQIFYQKKNRSLFFKFILPSLNRISKKIVSPSKYPVSVWKQEIPYGIALSCGGFCVIVGNLLSR